MDQDRNRSQDHQRQDHQRQDHQRQNQPQDQQRHQQQDPRRAQGGDQGRAGQDTDGDGKVVKPGQPPNQSHGKGLK